MLCLDLFNRIIGHADLTKPDMMKTAQKLWNVVLKCKGDQRAVTMCFRYVTGKARKKDGKAFLELLNGMNSP